MLSVRVYMLLTIILATNPVGQTWAHAVGASSLLSLSAEAGEEAAPFGFSWGPVGNIPKPSLAVREGNLTRLIYEHDRLPSNQLRDTAEVVLEVCRDQGLQQIIWVSRVLSASEDERSFEAILAEGTRRYGNPEFLEGGRIYWSASHTTLARLSIHGATRLLMVSTGPGLEACSEQHDAMTGHSLTDHWTRYLE
jgi:hypothetical protein